MVVHGIVGIAGIYSISLGCAGRSGRQVQQLHRCAQEGGSGDSHTHTQSCP